MNRLTTPSTLLLMALATPSIADDGWMAKGGSPTLMDSENPQVEMASEVIIVKIGKTKTTVDCNFIFKNHGPSTTVKMGFPDEDWFRDADEENNRPTLKPFESWIDGKKVKTTFQGKHGSAWYHTKTVTFKENQTIKVRDRYQVDTGGGFQGAGYFMDYAGYTLHTGATWKGPIGKVDIQITWDSNYFEPAKQAPYSALSAAMSNAYSDDPETYDKQHRVIFERNKKTVFWSGFTTPTFTKGMLRFQGTNLEPTQESDIFLAFRAHKNQP